MEMAGTGERFRMEAARRESAEGEDGRMRRRREGRMGESVAAVGREEWTASLWR
uniref:Uncharacterized protein n=1 Tax=Arundo donax TaxID=35708 RepID=A0A0A9AB55_ARUDO